MISYTRQQGFSLVTAIFMLVVLAGLIAYMVSISAVQHSTVAMSVQGARAMQAARSGLEYAIYQALNDGNCSDVTGTVTFGAVEPALQPFSVDLTCTNNTHTEGVTNVVFYTIQAVAENSHYIRNGLANPDYVSRSIRVTISGDLP